MNTKVQSRAVREASSACQKSTSRYPPHSAPFKPVLVARLLQHDPPGLVERWQHTFGSAVRTLGLKNQNLLTNDEYLLGATKDHNKGQLRLQTHVHV